MIIDFHTHVYPDRIAARTIQTLHDVSGLVACADGTLAGLHQEMRESGTDVSVVLPVMTKPSQFATINKTAARINEEGGGMISFGGIHPDTEDVRKAVRKIRQLGLPGIKLHPEYQHAYFDDIRYLRILDAAAEEGLLVVTHAGFDPVSPDVCHCTSKEILHVLQEVEGCRLVLAHFGGLKRWDEVERDIAGAPVWLDVSFLPWIPQDQFLRIAARHGLDKLLFASDWPWEKQADVLNCLNALPLPEEDRERIRAGNAVQLLGKRVEACLMKK